LEIAVYEAVGLVWSKISGRRGRPHQPFFVSGNYDHIVSYGVRMSAELSCVTDGRTDGFMIAKTALQSMQCGKNSVTIVVIVVLRDFLLTAPTF